MKTFLWTLMIISLVFPCGFLFMILHHGIRQKFAVFDFLLMAGMLWVIYDLGKTIILEHPWKKAPILKH